MFFFLLIYNIFFYLDKYHLLYDFILISIWLSLLMCIFFSSLSLFLSAFGCVIGIKLTPVIGHGSSATLIPLERMKTKVISTSNLSLRLSRNLRDLSSKYKGEVDDGRKVVTDENSMANPLCSPPPLNERDAEHIVRRFELEIWCCKSSHYYDFT